MSLIVWTRPSFVGASGVMAMAALPVVEQVTSNGSLVWIKILNLGLYGLNVFAVSQPGRIDSARQISQMEGGEKKSDDPEALNYYLSGKSLLTPSGWAFAIWGPIFLGELVFVTSSTLLVTNDSPIASLFKSVSGDFMMAQIFQTLWAASFRPTYQGYLAFIAPSMLTGIAVSLSRAHAHYSSSQASSRTTTLEYVLYFLPLSLHFGWTTAASLVNWNGSLAAFSSSSSENNGVLMTAVGHGSAVAGTLLGVYLTITRQAPVVGSVLAWALSACATGVGQRNKENLPSDTDKPTLEGPSAVAAQAQKWICAAGALVCLGAAAKVALTKKN